jgi:hypothetical protein
MAVSTISLNAALDIVTAKGIFDPRKQPSGYGDVLAQELGSEVMADLVCERFNWKWNRAVAQAIYTNSWQQDYPQIAQPGGIIGWGEDCDIVDINNTVIPKPLNWDSSITWVRQLTRTSLARWRPGKICWFYNKDLSYGVWPGAGVVFTPLVGQGPQNQNPIMSMVDGNGNLLIVTGFGTTGTAAPLLAANSAEGATVTDGSVVWTVVSPTSQGFRLDWLPNGAGQVWQILPYYQVEPPRFANANQLLTPIPDSFSRNFFRGLEAACIAADPNPGQMKRGEEARMAWLAAMVDNMKQGDREQNVYGLKPQTSPVESRWQNDAPYTADNPV